MLKRKFIISNAKIREEKKMNESCIQLKIFLRKHKKISIVIPPKMKANDQQGLGYKI